MVRVPVQIARSFRLPAPVERAWALLADVPAWGVLFPQIVSVEPFEPAGGVRQPGKPTEPAFLWRMAPLGPPGGRVETVYACRYHHAPETHTLRWTPVDGVGTAQFAGSCALRPEGDATDGDATVGTLRLDATLDIPAPSFVRAVVQPAVEFEMGRMTDTFIERLRTTLAV